MSNLVTRPRDDEVVTVREPSMPMLSVIIPTYNRLVRLRRVLDALAKQTTSEPFEVVVISDGSDDGTDEFLQSGATPVPVRALTQANAGPAAARNRGVLAARGRFVLFLDDDVVPEPELVERHLQTHQASSTDIVAIGPMLTPSDAQLTPWVAWEQHQLSKQYEALRNGTFRCSFRQFYTGNASVSRDRVMEVGLFDTKFRRAEDVELAFRLHEKGVEFTFVPEARGFHYAERRYESWLATAYEYGRNDVTFIREGQRWMTESIPDEFALRHPMVKALTRLCLPRRRLANVASVVLGRVGTSSIAGGRFQRQALSGLYNLTYYRGVAHELGSAAEFIQFIDRRVPSSQLPRAAFVMEQTLGHVAHSENLRRALQDSQDLAASFLYAPYEAVGAAEVIPLLGNSTIRIGLRARRAIRREYQRNFIDVMFIHTQVAAIFTGRWMSRIPTIVSLDATPVQYDEFGEHYFHSRSLGPVEAVKKRANIRCYERARHLVAWSDWARNSLIEDYRIDPSRITVIPPGVHIDQWGNDRSHESATGPVKVLFVGGDVNRKGGHLLVEAARVLRVEDSVPDFEVHLVTRSAVAAEPGVFIHNDLGANSSELIALYHESDILCLPTFADCLPMVLLEGAAAGLALLASDVGAIREIVRPDDTGLLVPPHDVDALVAALRRLVQDRDLRQRLGRAAHELALTDFNAQANAERIARLLLTLVPNWTRP
jgi:glycosyltransferase involved in cell wall biosynthesis